MRTSRKAYLRWKRQHCLPASSSDDGTLPPLAKRGSHTCTAPPRKGWWYTEGQKTADGGSYEGYYLDGRRELRGVRYYPNGQVLYRGGYTAGKFSGRGVRFRPDGEIIFDGLWQQDIPHGGKGKSKSPRGTTTMGNFVKGYVEGYGEEHYPNGKLKYSGMFLHGAYSGAGELYNENGDMIYSGQFQDGKYHGMGKLFGDGDACYEGSFACGKRDGRGEEVTVHGDRYVGVYQDDLRHGKGELLDGHDGSMYTGDFYLDLRHGQGLHKEIDGSSYDGKWSAGNYHGEGTLTMPNGVRLIGTFAAGELVNGKICHADGTLVYKGKFVDGLAHDENGYFRFDDGSFYTGGMKMGKRHGNGGAVIAVVQRQGDSSGLGFTSSTLLQRAEVDIDSDLFLPSYEDVRYFVGKRLNRIISLRLLDDVQELSHQFLDHLSKLAESSRRESAKIEMQVQGLRRRGARINWIDLERDTPLIKAIRRGDDKVAQLLLDFGADCSVVDVHGASALHYLAQTAPQMSSGSRSLALLHTLARECHGTIFAKDARGRTPLMIASSEGYVFDRRRPGKAHVALRIVKALIGYGGVAIVGMKDNEMKTALHHAIDSSNVNPLLLHELLRSGADPNVRDGNGYGALDMLWKRIDAAIAGATKAILLGETEKFVRSHAYDGSGVAERCAEALGKSVLDMSSLGDTAARRADPLIRRIYDTLTSRDGNETCIADVESELQKGSTAFHLCRPSCGVFQSIFQTLVNHGAVVCASSAPRNFLVQLQELHPALPPCPQISAQKGRFTSSVLQAYCKECTDYSIRGMVKPVTKDTGDCSGIPVIDAADMSPEIFWAEHFMKLRPVLVTNALSDNSWENARRIWGNFTELQHLFHKSSVKVRVASIPYAAGFGIEQHEISMMNYTQQIFHGEGPAKDLYLFAAVGDRRNKKCGLHDTMLPTAGDFDAILGLDARFEREFEQIYLGRKDTGSPMHFHTDAVNALVAGRKRWVVASPKSSFYSLENASSFFHRTLPTILGRFEEMGLDVSICDQPAGSIFYIPRGFSHAVLNLETSVGTAIEFSPPASLGRKPESPDVQIPIKEDHVTGIILENGHLQRKSYEGTFQDVREALVAGRDPQEDCIY